MSFEGRGPACAPKTNAQGRTVALTTPRRPRLAGTAAQPPRERRTREHGAHRPLEEAESEPSAAAGESSPGDTVTQFCVPRRPPGCPASLSPGPGLFSSVPGPADKSRTGRRLASGGGQRRPLGQPSGAETRSPGLPSSADSLAESRGLPHAGRGCEARPGPAHGEPGSFASGKNQ